MNQDLYQILQSIQAHIYQQDRKILSLQKKISTLQQKITELEKRPPIKVERMEYKFDQLKVETLEGTLNIGLNPSDLQGIEDFSVPGKSGPPPPAERMKMFTDIEDSINQYLDTNIQSIVEDAGQQLQFRVEHTHYDFILQDIKKQLPNRIEFYLDQPPLNAEESPQQQKEHILEQVKKEIHHGVLTFLQNLPENMKGKRPE
jgi:spore germination protein PC